MLNVFEDVIYIRIAGSHNNFRLFLVRPARTYSNGCKSLKRPDNGKYIANGKGVHREVESEGSLRQTSGLTYRNLILRLKDVDKFAKQNEVL